MSSRALRKLHGNQDLDIIKNGQNTDEEEEEEHESLLTCKKKNRKPINPFLLVQFCILSTQLCTSVVIWENRIIVMYLLLLWLFSVLRLSHNSMDNIYYTDDDFNLLYYMGMSQFNFKQLRYPQFTYCLITQYL